MNTSSALPVPDGLLASAMCSSDQDDCRLQTAAVCAEQSLSSTSCNLGVAGLLGADPLVHVVVQSWCRVQTCSWRQCLRRFTVASITQGPELY